MRIVGTATKKFSPDTAIIYMNLDAVGKTADLAKSIFTNKATLLTNIIKQLGFNPEDLRTEHFFVDKNYEYNNNKRVQNGFRADCTYSLVIELDYSALEQLITSLSQALEMRITYNVMLKEAEKEEQSVLDLAIADARRKAEVVAKSCGVTLGEIVGINYEESPSFAGLRAVNGESNLAPTDVTITKTIELMWEIK